MSKPGISRELRPALLCRADRGSVSKGPAPLRRSETGCTTPRCSDTYTAPPARRAGLAPRRSAGSLEGGAWPVRGAIADRYRRRSVLLAGDALRMLLMAALAATVASAGPVALIIAFTALTSAAGCGLGLRGLDALNARCADALASRVTGRRLGATRRPRGGARPAARAGSQQHRARSAGPAGRDCGGRRPALGEDVTIGEPTVVVAGAGLARRVLRGPVRLPGRRLAGAVRRDVQSVAAGTAVAVAAGPVAGLIEEDLAAAG